MTEKMDFYTMVLRKSGIYWIALCLENGLVGQGDTKENAISKLREAVSSFEDALNEDQEIYTCPLCIKDLHEFLTIEGNDPRSETYELRAVNA